MNRNLTKYFITLYFNGQQSCPEESAVRCIYNLNLFHPKFLWFPNLHPHTTCSFTSRIQQRIIYSRNQTTVQNQTNKSSRVVWANLLQESWGWSLLPSGNLTKIPYTFFQARVKILI